MGAYLTRLCWNTNGWTMPAGVAPLAEGPARGSGPTFVSEYGYGHEEWLFQSNHVLAGWRYGFVQPALKVTEDRYGQVIDAVLYTIAPGGERFYLGRIAGLEILGTDAAAQARDAFTTAGWSGQMADDLDALELSKKNLQVSRDKSRDFLNVRFRPDAVHMLLEPIRATVDDITYQRGKNRYQFYPLDILPPALQNSAADPNKPTSGYRYQTAPVVDADRRHNRIQLHLTSLLRARYGEAAVRMEVDGVDIVLSIDGVTTFVEVKSEGDPRLAIRAALGQLLEYALFARKVATAPTLVIAAPGELDPAGMEYISQLRTRFSLPIRYIRVDETTAVSPL